MERSKVVLTTQGATRAIIRYYRNEMAIHVIKDLVAEFAAREREQLLVEFTIVNALA